MPIYQDHLACSLWLQEYASGCQVTEYEYFFVTATNDNTHKMLTVQLVIKYAL